MLYLYIDEAGDLGFNVQGTRYFILVALSTQRPFWWYPSLLDLKHDIISGPHSVELEYFHCAKDNRHVRSQVFDLIAKNLTGIRVDAIIVEKQKAHPSMQQPGRFYAEMLKILVNYSIRGWAFQRSVERAIMIADRSPYSGSKRSTVEGAAKSALKSALPGTPFSLFFHSSAAHGGLQVADYFGWALQRYWERKDGGSLGLVDAAIKSQFDVFGSGTIYYY